MRGSQYDNLIDIVTPDSFNVVTSIAVRSCEIFFNRLLSCSLPELKITIDAENRSVSCVDQGVKHLLQLICGAGEWPAFTMQLMEYLRKPSLAQKNEGILSLVTRDRPYDYLVTIDAASQQHQTIQIQVVATP